MSEIRTTQTVTDRLVSMVQTAKPKTAQELVFKDMLADAMQAGASRQDTQPKTGRPEKQPKPQKAEAQQPDAQNSAAQPSEQAMAAQAAQAQTPVQTQPEQAVKPQTEAVTASQAPQAVEQQVPVAQQPAQAPETPRTQQVQADVQAPVPQPAQDKESAQVVTERPQQAVQPDQPQTETPQQAKFDEMLTKAAQELDAAKPTQQPAQPQEAAQAEPILVQDEVPPAPAEPKTEQTISLEEAEAGGVSEQPEARPTDEPKAQQVVERENARQSELPLEKPTPRAAILSDAQAPKLEQKPLRELPKADEDSLGLLQQKQPEIRADEPVRTETRQPAQPVREPDQTERIRTEVIRNVENTKMEFRMQLQPQELGKIDVKMVLEGGKLAVEIMAANQKSAELLTKQAEHLIAGLRQGNLDISSVNIVAASSEASGQMKDPMSGQMSGAFENRQEPRNEHTSRGAGSQYQGFAEDEEADAQAAPEQLLNYSV